MQGLVLAEPAGSATLYRLNREHLLCGPILEMVAARRCLLERLRARLEQWTVPCEHASLFGSVARGDDTAGSDVDVLVVRRLDVEVFDPTWQDQLRSLEEDVLSWTGNRLAWFETTIEDLGRAAAADEPLLHALRRDAVPLAGAHVSSILARVGA